MEKGSKPRTSLRSWIRRSYVRTALIPLVLVELVFISIYFLTSNWSRTETTDYLLETEQAQLTRIAAQQSMILSHQLQGVAHTTELLRRQTEWHLTQPAVLDPVDKARLSLRSDGLCHTMSDRADGGAAVFYSGLHPVGKPQMEKVARLLASQTLLRDVVKGEPLVVSAYMNTYDSLNVIYPYFDVISQYPAKMDIPTYNFYYEADAAHNPERSVVWTDAYLDPAGHGWMISCIAPVYNGDFLEGVVGLDMTLEAFVEQTLALSLPWEGYGMLLDGDGMILALPPAGEADWGLDELTTYDYAHAVLKDTFKPGDFNLYRRADMSGFSAAIAGAETGYRKLLLKGESKAVSWATVPDTDWKLLLLVPEANLLARLNKMAARLSQIGYFMIVGLLSFYMAFFFYLSHIAGKMSRNISSPLSEIRGQVHQIGEGIYQLPEPDMAVRELQETAVEIVAMGRRLGDMTDALTQAKEDAIHASQTKSRFLSHMSHEFRTPLHAILGFTQIMTLDASAPLTEAQADSLNEIRKAGQHLLALINDVLDLTAIESGRNQVRMEAVDAEEVLSDAESQIRPLAAERRIALARGAHHPASSLVLADRTKLRQVLLNLLNNAVKYNREGGLIHTGMQAVEDCLSISIRDTGPGIPDEARERIFDPFLRLPSAEGMEGAGIGLAVTKGMVEQMGGRIVVESTPGEGACFTVSFKASPQGLPLGNPEDTETKRDSERIFT